jgi:hypothetical protein
MKWAAVGVLAYKAPHASMALIRTLGFDTTSKVGG